MYMLMQSDHILGQLEDKEDYKYDTILGLLDEHSRTQWSYLIMKRISLITSLLSTVIRDKMTNWGKNRIEF